MSLAFAAAKWRACAPTHSQDNARFRHDAEVGAARSAARALLKSTVRRTPCTAPRRGGSRRAGHAPLNASPDKSSPAGDWCIAAIAAVTRVLVCGGRGGATHHSRQPRQEQPPRYSAHHRHRRRCACVCARAWAQVVLPEARRQALADVVAGYLGVEREEALLPGRLREVADLDPKKPTSEWWVPTQVLQEQTGRRVGAFGGQVLEPCRAR